MVQLMQKFAPRSLSEFFAMNAPDPPHWSLTLCFVLFRSVWVHFGLFHCFTILGSKRAELLKLMQKFMPQSCVRVFCNKATLSTPSSLNSCFGAFHSVWVHLLSFRNCMKLGAKLDELEQLMQKFMPRSHVVIFSQQTHTIHPIGP